MEAYNTLFPQNSWIHTSTVDHNHQQDAVPPPHTDDWSKDPAAPAPSAAAAIDLTDPAFGLADIQGEPKTLHIISRVENATRSARGPPSGRTFVASPLFFVLPTC